MTVSKRSKLEVNKIASSLEMKSFKVNKTKMTLFCFNYKELSTSLWLSAVCYIIKLREPTE